MDVFHKLNKSKLDDVYSNGIKCLNDTVDDKPEIQRTDSFLNDHRPEARIAEGLDRTTNTYCYIASGENIVDIRTGNVVPPRSVLETPNDVLLRITIDANHAFISDLDMYDHIMDLLTRDDSAEAERTARIYWQSLQLAAHYTNQLRRPEVIITYDIPPDAIKEVISFS